MEKKLDLELFNIRFTSYNSKEKKEIGKNICLLGFDDRKDFLFDDSICGVAAMVSMVNNCHDEDTPRSVYHNVLFTLIDNEDRAAVFAVRKNIYIPKDESIEFFYFDFRLPDTQLQAGHTYRLVVQDLKAEVTLGEVAFHLFSEKELGRAENWYRVCEGGIRPAWEDQLAASLKVLPGKDYMLCFDLHQRFSRNPPLIRPELEMRLHEVGNDYVKTCFVEPRCISIHDNQYRVEQNFYTFYESGLYYVELRCMGHPIGGFVFDVSRDSKERPWVGCGVDPLDEYSPEAVKARLERYFGDFSDPAQDEERQFYDKLATDIFEGSMGQQESDDAADGESIADPVLSDEEETDKLFDFDDEDLDPEIPEKKTDPASFAEKLGQLTGLVSVKEKLLDYSNIMRFNKMRSDSGLPVVSLPLHSMFLGSPGTGKTTVAKMVGEMLHDMGLLSEGHVVVRERATLLGQFYNSESEKTLAALEEARGGILFIDEAYQLHQPNDPRDPGKFVIETLLTALADESNRDWMLILAGYPNPMEKMLEMNPGFKSRIPDTNIYLFEDFTEDELLEIARNYLTRCQYHLSPEADNALAHRLRTDYEQRDGSFGNARHVMNLIQTEILPAMARRVVGNLSPDNPNLTDILASDIPRCPLRVATPRPRIGYAC